VSENFEENYDMKSENKSYSINFFEEIGWFDPFPANSFLTDVYDESELTGLDITENIYPASRTCCPNHYPSAIYLPKRELMFAMMRACVGVDSQKDLFFNRFVKKFD